MFWGRQQRSLWDAPQRLGLLLASLPQTLPRLLGTIFKLLFDLQLGMTFVQLVTHLLGQLNPWPAGPSDPAQTLDCTSSFSILQDVLTAALDPSHIHNKSMMSPLRETVSSSKSPCPSVPPLQEDSGHPRAPHGAMWDNLQGASGVGLALTWPPTPRAPSGGAGGLMAVAVP